jgi:3-oxoadipate enol-lactonase
MRAICANGVILHVRDGSDPNGAPVVFANSLGTDLRLWDELIPLVPAGLRLICYDKRGHGLSDCPDGPYSIDDLAADAVAVIETLDLGPVTFVGLSIGGMIAQRVAAVRPDLVRALVLSNTAVKMGEPAMWADRIAAIRADGLPALETAILDRWFGPTFRATSQAVLWGAMVSRTPPVGYIACCDAIANADLTDSTSGLRVPTLVIAGGNDGASPPDLVAATAAFIQNAEFCVIEGAGHLPCVEDPAAFAALLNPFLMEHAYD